jgi:hypothetical protein
MKTSFVRLVCITSVMLLGSAGLAAEFGTKLPGGPSIGDPVQKLAFSRLSGHVCWSCFG